MKTSLLFALMFVGASAAAESKIETQFKKLEFAPLQERLKDGVETMSRRELFASAQLLLSAASKRNEDLGFTMLSKVTRGDVPCIEYYRAEWALRKGRPKQALTEIESFIKTKEIACDASKKDLYSCCPASKYRNAAGLRAMAKYLSSAPATVDVQAKGAVPAAAKDAKVPLVEWQKLGFLVDTGAEHHVWNSKCSKELGLVIDKAGTYGGGDSAGATVVAQFARPSKKVLGVDSARMAGFAFDLDSSAADYSKLLGKGVKFCGIVSPQRMIPGGVMVFDWQAKALLFCDSPKCRKAFDLPVNCPMYQFNGRPYFNAQVNAEPARLFLIDTGANSSSANLNYFDSAQAGLQTVDATVAGVRGAKGKIQVLPSAKLSFCGIGFNVKPFSLRDAERSWEWNENGKLGMNSLFGAVIALDFGRGMGLVQ